MVLSEYKRFNELNCQTYYEGVTAIVIAIIILCIVIMCCTYEIVKAIKK